ncbi:MAG TPA: alpha-1,4-glucan--maltose-1-phosphate maltosyltransferase [Acidimicrobiales bacterium]|nr:alpha-1,4-glucan--maltose-1-phosphate maltosyltransferase [Acidimicrobiales bacterium]
MLGRLVIDRVRPRALDGDHPAKATVGEVVPVRAWIHRDGHDQLAARVLWHRVDGPWHAAPLRELGNDEWAGELVADDLGLHELVIEAWADHLGTWARELVVRAGAGDDLAPEFVDGARRCRRLLPVAGPGPAADLLRDAATALERTECADRVRVDVGTEPALVALGASLPDPHDRAVSAPVELWVDRPRARFSAWYELFPRSEGGLVGTTGRLDDVAAMGFDVVYLPPVHPIGTTARKGANNTLTAAPDDPGSPWAIGSPLGGHTALDPDLGTIDDFAALVARAHDLGMEVALDYALQCSPDHPWVTEHPDWFHHRPDGSIRFAENPPKKYQDIYPINFWPSSADGTPDEAARQELWVACKEILDVWIERGVRIFRVDNPHTKPMALWEWLLPAVRAEQPDVVFLSEAFTRPKVMAKLAEVGFTQSYTYFTWRHTKDELTDYLVELSGDLADWLRPNFWPNTPDILGGVLRRGNRAAFKLRATLAALLSPSWGIYSGYELLENEPASDDNEEYLHSEKYEIKHRDWGRSDSLASYLARLNEVRRSFPALQELRTIRFHWADNDQIIVWSKTRPDGSDPVVVVVNLDPSARQSATLGLDLGALGLPATADVVWHDAISGARFTWRGPDPWVQLDPAVESAHVLTLRPCGPAAGGAS